jgi:hypothetical protein
MFFPGRAREGLLGICFWGGVPEGLAEEIGEGRKGLRGKEGVE